MGLQFKGRVPTYLACTRPWEQSTATHNNISTLANQNQLLASLLKENYHPQSNSAMDVVCNNTDKSAK